MGDPTFCTLIHCIDGRFQRSAHDATRSRFQTDYVDVITEPGAVKHFADADSPELKAILDRVAVSMEAHASRHLAVAAHDDCAGNPATEMEQRAQLRQAVSLLARRFPRCEIVGVWVDNSLSCEVVCAKGPEGGAAGSC